MKTLKTRKSLVLSRAIVSYKRSDVVLNSYNFSKVVPCRVIPVGTTKQYQHSNRSSVAKFSPRKSMYANTYIAVAWFCHARSHGEAKRVRNKNKKMSGIIFKLRLKIQKIQRPTGNGSSIPGLGGQSIGNKWSVMRAHGWSENGVQK